MELREDISQIIHEKLSNKYEPVKKKIRASDIPPYHQNKKKLHGKLKASCSHTIKSWHSGMGHLIPLVELGNRLVTNHDFDVTIFVVTADPSLSKSKLLKLSPTAHLNGIKIVLLPSVDISDMVNPTMSIATQLAIMMRRALPNLRDTISSMKVKPNVLIVDFFGTEAYAVADEFRMKKYLFMTSNAWFLALVIFLPSVGKGEKENHVNNKDPLNIPGCMSLRFEDSLKAIVEIVDDNLKEYVRMGEEIRSSDGILVNTWEDLEPSTLSSLRNEKMLGKFLKGSVYTVGPLVRRAKPDSESELMSWLDKQPTESVVYVSFGSGGALSAKQTTELANGLEMSEQRFLWVLRPPIENDASANLFKSKKRSDHTPNYLPDGFFTRTKERGLVVPMWAPQAEILEHGSVGGFVSHCGWNSSLESIANGVPMVVWPLYAEQKMNATLLTEEIGVAIRPNILPGTGVVGKEEIATTIKKLMVEKEGDAVRERVKTLKLSAQRAIAKGGDYVRALAAVLLK